MKLQRKNKNKSEISTSSLPDIIFMLLIFFMVTTVMREFEGLDVVLPRAKTIEKLESKRHTSYIWSTKDGLVSVDDKLVNVIESNEPMSHSKKLPIMLKSAIQDFNKIEDVHAFSISVGPGSFTSLRISMSLVKGLVFSLKANIIPVPTLESINYQIDDQGSYYLILDCYKNKCFVQKFKNNQPTSDPYIDSVENLSKVDSKFYGYSEKVQDDMFKISVIKPSSIFIGEFAINNMSLSKHDSKDVKPIYLSEHEYVKIDDSKSRK